MMERPCKFQVDGDRSIVYCLLRTQAPAMLKLLKHVIARHGLEIDDDTAEFAYTVLRAIEEGEALDRAAAPSEP